MPNILYKNTQDVATARQSYTYAFPTPLAAGDYVLAFLTTGQGNTEPVMTMTVNGRNGTKLQSRALLDTDQTGTPDWGAVFGIPAAAGDTSVEVSMSEVYSVFIIVIRGAVYLNSAAAGNTGGISYMPSLSGAKANGLFLGLINRAPSSYVPPAFYTEAIARATGLSMEAHYKIGDSGGGYAVASSGDATSSKYLGTFALLFGPINQTPNTTVTNSPKGTASSPSIQGSLTPLLDWSFSDPDVGDVQSKYQLRIKKASDNSIVHDTGLVTSASTDYVVPAGVLAKDVTYYWEVMTQDQGGLSSSYSSAEYFIIGATAAVGDVFTFNYTGEPQTWKRPVNVTKVKVEVYGAEGGYHDYPSYAAVLPGKGGYAVGNIPVNSDLHVYVGGSGKSANTASRGSKTGWNGGGDNQARIVWGTKVGGGGGASDVRTVINADPLNAASLASRLLVAGGGGGANYTAGGAGGGLAGTKGGDGVGYGYGGSGGTQTAGGVAGRTSEEANVAGNAGTLGKGGNGVASGASGGSAGGGGYYGGGGASAGASHGGAGGGGSSFIGTLEGSSTLSGTNQGDGKVVITVIEASTALTIINRDPGTNDQLIPEGSVPAPLFSWAFSDTSFTQAKYQIKIYDGTTLAHDTGLITSTVKQHQMAAGILTPGKTYGWEITVQNAAGAAYPSSRIYFITNRPPGAPTLVNPVDRFRTGLRPTFWATIGDDVENDPQKFVMQIAEDTGFTVGVQERSSESTVSGWQAKTESGTYGDLPATGVDSTYEGGTVKYTWPSNLTEGKTYFWRMAGIDGITGSRGAWSEVRSIRVGNRIDVTLKKPVVTSAAIQRLLVRASYNLATDGAIPATAICEATNNALDEEPTWEDVTNAVISGEYHKFKNDVKTDSDWAFNIRMTFQANDSLDPIEFYGFGVSFD